MEEKDLSKLTDEQLTPEQLKKRVKRRNQKAKKRAKDASSNSKKVNSTKKQQASASQEQKTVAEPRLSDEEFQAQKIEEKTSRIKQNPRASVVTLAESVEAKSVAFKINEINMISAFTRDNMGTDRLSFENGAILIELFQNKVISSIENYIHTAASFGVGGRRTLEEYKKEQKTLQNNEVTAQKKLDRIQRTNELSITREIPAETKQRESEDKTLEKANLDLEKALEALEKAQVKVDEAKQASESAKETVDNGFKERIDAQKQRFAEEQKAKKEEAEKLNEDTKPSTEKVQAEDKKAETSAKQ